MSGPFSVSSARSRTERHRPKGFPTRAPPHLQRHCGAKRDRPAGIAATPRPRSPRHRGNLFEPEPRARHKGIHRQVVGLITRREVMNYDGATARPISAKATAPVGPVSGAISCGATTCRRPLRAVATSSELCADGQVYAQPLLSKKRLDSYFLGDRHSRKIKFT